MMRRMASKGIFESKYGSGERGAIWQNIAGSLNNCEEFALTARSLRDHFTTLMKSCKSKPRWEVKGTGSEGDKLSENEQLLEDLIERFKESERSRTRADTLKKTALYRKRKKKKNKKINKAQEIKKKKSNGKDLERWQWHWKLEIKAK